MLESWLGFEKTVKSIQALPFTGFNSSTAPPTFAPGFPAGGFPPLAAASSSAGGSLSK